MRIFNQIRLQTPESVEIEFTLAGIGNRALALLIDYTVLALTGTLALIAWSFVAGQLLELVAEWTGSADRLGLWLFAITLLVTFALYGGYFVFFETLWQGQTPGKRLTGIRVISADGRPTGLAQATLRALLRPFDDFFFIGAFLIALSRREQRLGDLVAGTLVIQEVRPLTTAAFPVSEAAKQLAGQLVQQADLSQLRPDDFAVIREYLQRRRVMNLGARQRLSLNLARQARKAIALEHVPPGTSAETFLEAIYLAYSNPTSVVNTDRA